MPVPARQGSYRNHGLRIAYTDYDGGGAPLVLMPGLLLSREMHHPLAAALAEKGHRIITLDPRGHGTSDRPGDMSRYSVEQLAGDCVGLIRHLRIDRAVVGGTSLGANIALEVAAQAPRRLSGLLVEMPALDNAVPVATVLFSSLMAALILGAPAYRLMARTLRAVPRRRLPVYGRVVLDLLRQQPGPSAAMIRGLFFARVAPSREQRRTLSTPTLVIGHRRDPLHPFSDADTLARELPRARLVQANSVIELRIAPARLTAVIHEFLVDCSRQKPPLRAGRRP